MQKQSKNDLGSDQRDREEEDDETSDEDISQMQNDQIDKLADNNYENDQFR